MMGKELAVHGFNFTFTILPIEEKCKQLESMEWEVEDFEDVLKQIHKETGESDLDKLVKNFIQSKSTLNITEAMEAEHFVSN